jgi:hypothetical protein
MAHPRARTAKASFNNHLVKPPAPKSVENVLADLKWCEVQKPEEACRAC